jgi:hypothetical protein
MLKIYDKNNVLIDEKNLLLKIASQKKREKGKTNTISKVTNCREYG